jgi:DNA-binding response OmpR family regulator
MLTSSGKPLVALELRLILIVEDDPETRRFYTNMLAAAGYAIDTAHNGFQALEKAVAAPPDLVLTDIAVPGIDGIELCRRLRLDVRTQAVRLLAVTGYDDRRYPDRALRAGADDVLLKPVDAQVLLAAVRRLLAQQTSLMDV